MSDFFDRGVVFYSRVCLVHLRIVQLIEFIVEKKNKRRKTIFVRIIEVLVIRSSCRTL